ncbi:unnamed protein product [Rotaria sordida]|uniref:Uncharacterized protein n=1 Tax=Rotaria sordida TaxID=392033 RepID=A0A814JI87_9BILA|nr:unnamed protein product [Rotaria sordida]CAF1183792.1 unnamed protein product [Rotaria sordida]
MTHFFERYGIYRNNHLDYHLVIDIGESTAPESVVYYTNQDALDPTSVIGRHDNPKLPPYPAQSAIEFCSSYGQSFSTC